MNANLLDAEKVFTVGDAPGDVGSVRVFGIWVSILS